ncbi:MAG: FMN-binding protein [Eubacteriales bacterium]|nr:FMN-binding protein [Eubacteriales bacterium]
MPKSVALKDRGVMPALILFLICLVSTAALAMTYELTAERRALLVETALLENKQLLFPNGEEFTPLELPEEFSPEQIPLFEAVRAADGTELGYLVQAMVKGYGSDPVEVLTALSPTGEVLGVLVGDNAETAGLGKRIEEAEFRDQFSGYQLSSFFSTDGQSPSGLNLEPAKIDSISGATISSEAVCTGVNWATTALRGLLD